MAKPPNLSLMVVEDDVVDVEVVRRGVRKRGLQFGVYAEQDGQRALDFLRGDTLSPEQRERTIVLLDINMPGMNGHQFLEALRKDDLLRRTLVFVLTTSNHPSDRSQAYDKNVAGYFVKSNVEGLLDAVALYAEHVEFPPAP